MYVLRNCPSFSFGAACSQDALLNPICELFTAGGIRQGPVGTRFGRCESRRVVTGIPFPSLASMDDSWESLIPSSDERRRRACVIFATTKDDETSDHPGLAIELLQSTDARAAAVAALGSPRPGKAR
jgi:hypothetical protein